MLQNFSIMDACWPERTAIFYPCFGKWGICGKAPSGWISRVFAFRGEFYEHVTTKIWNLMVSGKSRITFIDRERILECCGTCLKPRPAACFHPAPPRIIAHFIRRNRAQSSSPKAARRIIGPCLYCSLLCKQGDALNHKNPVVAVNSTLRRVLVMVPAFPYAAAAVSRSIEWVAPVGGGTDDLW